jgi:hypothetical protein
VVWSWDCRGARYSERERGGSDAEKERIDIDELGRKGMRGWCPPNPCENGYGPGVCCRQD